jgi:hypothetical protein
MGGIQPARALDDEIHHLSVNGPQLPATARLAVSGVLESLLAEGAFDLRQAQTVQALRDALAPTGIDRAA